MAIQPQKFRELVFQMIYSFDMGNLDDSSIAQMLMKELKVTRKTSLQALERAKEISAKKEQLDKVIQSHSSDYPIDRIHSVERSVLRLALFEMMYDDTIPPKVAISEAIRMGKKFSTSEATRFINGLLDSIYKENYGTEAAAEPEDSEEQTS